MMADTGDPIRDALLGVEVPEEHSRECLERAEFGVLALSNGSEAYSIPVSFGYDSGVRTLYFLFGFDESNRKAAFIETTDTASFTVVDSELPDAWESVLVTGTVEPVPDDEEEEAYAALAETATFPAASTLEEYVDETNLSHALYELDVETINGRSANPGQLSGEL